MINTLIIFCCSLSCLIGCEIVNNTAVTGGGINDGSLWDGNTYRRCIIAGNTAEWGGGIYLNQGDPLIVYCPAFEEADADVDAYLSSVIKPAVGFEIRLA